MLQVMLQKRGLKFALSSLVKMAAPMKHPFISLAISMAMAASFRWSSTLVLPNVRTLKKYQYASCVKNCNLMGCVVPKLAISSDRLAIMILLPLSVRLLAAEYNLSHTYLSINFEL